MDNAKIEELVATLRSNGALVGHTPGKSASVDVIKGYGEDRLFVDVEYVDEAVQALLMRASLGDVTKADMLLLTILENSGVLRKPEK